MGREGLQRSLLHRSSSDSTTPYMFGDRYDFDPITQRCENLDDKRIADSDDYIDTWHVAEL